MPEINEREEGVVLTVWVQPRSSRAGIVGIQRDALKIKVCSPSQENRANKETIEILADFFKIPKSKISILSGKTFRRKKVLLYGKKCDDILKTIEQF
ncbi:DUF167 domain-containing protein [Candidatus Oleimmundimicrobium sp.]|uniref:DUF167 domain-containing protein n=1 Tax=Candidatus Oleimmundimicrobium sp. TaxID=3060597 RepID=UPI00271C9D82|nr:DUF167 domain-containing protein [Candidatus Oleimmundimicrobium sp.]MDO8885520.1 DUF167 domain-containing protein [Candidatus Oleimmundimicrobium sp.]